MPIRVDGTDVVASTADAVEAAAAAADPNDEGKPRTIEEVATRETLIRAEMAKIGEEARRRAQDEWMTRLLAELPETYKIAEKDWSIAKKPLGHLSAIGKALAALLSHQGDWQRILSAEDPAEMFRLATEGIDEVEESLVQIVRLIFEPVTGKPIDLANLALSADDVRWRSELSTPDISQIVTRFFIVNNVGQVLRNVLALRLLVP